MMYNKTFLYHAVFIKKKIIEDPFEEKEAEKYSSEVIIICGKSLIKKDFSKRSSIYSLEFPEINFYENELNKDYIRDFNFHLGKKKTQIIVPNKDIFIKNLKVCAFVNGIHLDLNSNIVGLIDYLEIVSNKSFEFFEYIKSIFGFKNDTSFPDYNPNANIYTQMEFWKSNMESMIIILFVFYLRYLIVTGQISEAHYIENIKYLRRDLEDKAVVDFNTSKFLKDWNQTKTIPYNVVKFLRS